MAKVKTASKLLAVLLVLVLAVSILPMSAMAFTVTDGISIASGEPVGITWNSSTTGTIANVDGTSYVPQNFLLWVEGTSVTVTDSTGTLTAVDSHQVKDESGTTSTVSAFNITATTSTSTVTVVISSSAYGLEGTYTFSCAAKNGTAPSSIVNAVPNYLPVGQFARGNTWGTSFSNGTNATGTTKKFVASAYASTGVSLGAAGGYIQTDLSTPIYNLSTNPYGVDFIAYGNAFTGNPEAGAVKVYGFTSASDETGEWYDLAGSLYYTNQAITNATVTYTKQSDGIYYSVNSGTATQFTSNTTWWPEYTDESYCNVYDGDDDYCTWSSDHNTITYSGVTLTKDTDTNSDYQFGYFDVHANGSSYGTAANPYTIANNGTGGDGFDLAWAVDPSTKLPVSLHHITKIRFYSSAALTTSSGVATTTFTTPSIFGETSAEFCGVFKATGTGSGEASEEYNYVSISGITTIADNTEGAIQVSAGVYTIESTADHIFINGSVAADGDTVTLSSGSKVQIITQSGTESPRVILLYC